MEQTRPGNRSFTIEPPERTLSELASRIVDAKWAASRGYDWAPDALRSLLSEIAFFAEPGQLRDAIREAGQLGALDPPTPPADVPCPPVPAWVQLRITDTSWLVVYQHILHVHTANEGGASVTREGLADDFDVSLTAMGMVLSDLVNDGLLHITRCRMLYDGPCGWTFYHLPRGYV